MESGNCRKTRKSPEITCDRKIHRPIPVAPMLALDRDGSRDVAAEGLALGIRSWVRSRNACHFLQRSRKISGCRVPARCFER